MTLAETSKVCKLLVTNINYKSATIASTAFHILPPSSDAKRLPVYQYLSHCGEKVADEMDKSFTCDEILSASSYKSSKTSSSINDGNETFFGSSEYRTLSNMLLSRVV